jgi:hypothetical protein
MLKNILILRCSCGFINRYFVGFRIVTKNENVTSLGCSQTLYVLLNSVAGVSVKAIKQQITVCVSQLALASII